MSEKLTADVYQEMCLRTVPDEMKFWTMPVLAGEEARKRLFLNCALGMSGEAGEIADEGHKVSEGGIAGYTKGLPALADEIGDGYWYSYVMLSVFGKSNISPSFRTERGVPGARIALFEGLYERSSGLCELAKKVIFHGRFLQDVTEDATKLTQDYILILQSLDPYPLGETHYLNIEKLKARYPEGFFERG